MVAPAAPPMPYLPYVMIKPDTHAGVKSYRVSLILDLIFSAFALTIALTVISVSLSEPSQVVSFGAIVSAAACGLVIVFVINFIMSLLSVMRMHHGSHEYGPEHERYASRGVLFKWLGTTMSTAAAVIIVYILVAGGLSVFFFAGPTSTTLYLPILVTLFWTAGVTFKGQMYSNMVHVLQPAETVRWSKVAGVVIPVLGLFGVALVGAATARILDAIANPLTTNPVELTRLSTLIIGGIFLPPGLAIFGYILFYMVYARTEQRLTAGLYQTYQQLVPPGTWPGTGYAQPGSPAPGPVGVPLPTPPPPPSATSGTKTCPRCGQSVAAAYAFCQNCGTKVPT